ncbi:MAG: HAMP domain-containing protein [Chloroflexota bacterium]
MRSLSSKLTLAFLAVGLISVVIVALVVGSLARREFDRFIANRDQTELADRVAQYYATTGSWENLNNDQDSRFPSRFPTLRQQVWLLDAEGNVVFGPPAPHGQESVSDENQQSLPIEVDGNVGGTLIFEENPVIAGLREPLEQAYVTAINRSVLLSAAMATLLALALGALLAYTISRPVRELTDATRAVAQGELGRQVPVRTRDDLGELATSFNHMSEDLARANQTRQQMTADIAHDLRTPLSVILGYTEALNDGKLHGNPDIYQAMHLQSQHLSRLIDDLRTLSLADAGQLSLRMESVPPCSLIDYTALVYAAQAESGQITLQTDCDPDCPTVVADTDRMMQVLGNLVSNALRHTPAGGQVTLAAECLDGQVQLAVRIPAVVSRPRICPTFLIAFTGRTRRARQTAQPGLAWRLPGRW